MGIEPAAVIGVGVAVSLLFDRRTGLGSGGFVGPGTVALSLGDPRRLLWGLAASLLVAAALRLGVRLWGWYGRTRVGFALLLAIVFRLALGRFMPEGLWVGWVVPGLIASDVERQGVWDTLTAVTATSLATSFLVTLAGAAGVAL